MRVLLLLCYFYYILSVTEAENDVSKKTKDKKDDKLPVCQACKAVVNSFLKGMEATNKNHYGGGDAAYEQEKLGSYAESETRLVEIQERVCSDVIRGQNQCYQLAEEWEPLLEKWWFDKTLDTKRDLFNWLCIDTLSHCCPNQHFGPQCQPCSSFPNVCNSNGKCKGAGTRKGNGECDCNEGYAGKMCEKCSETHYESYRDESKLLCSKCHKSCKNTCTTSGPKGCKECKSGWIFLEEKGCIDHNECISSSTCTKDQFCVNNEGSYSCIDCDEACDGCYGDGPDMCNNCASGFTLKDKICVGKRKSRTQQTETWTRYLTYLGLCVATCIIFQKNTTLAAIIGVTVAIYVSVSEYLIANFLNLSDESRNSFETIIKT